MKVSTTMLLFFFGFGWVCSGQNNYIYNGGAAHGFSSMRMKIGSNNSIFSGNSSDGFDKIEYAQASKKWVGGVDDGFSFQRFDVQMINAIFAGSEEDGMAFTTYAQSSNSEFFHGGVEDGFSFEVIGNLDSGLVHSGGAGDGFSASGISKLIWDGDLSKDWLMADNWNIPIVPTMNHSVCIPGGVPNYPKLSDVLGISIVEEHTYASKSVTIMEGGLINGIGNIQIIVNGKLIVAGDLFITPGTSARFIGRKDGMIRILNGGEIRID